MNIGAYFYNHNLKTRGGRMEAIDQRQERPGTSPKRRRRLSSGA